MRPIDFVLLIATAIALGLSIGAVNDAKPKPTPDCPCVDCTCDPCECGPVDAEIDTNPVVDDEKENVIHKQAITYFFTMPACVPCEQSKPHINAAHHEGYTVYVVDLSRKDLIDRYGVTSWPTTVVTRGGIEVDRHTGRIDGRTLQGIFANHGIQPKQRAIPAPSSQPTAIRHDAYQMRAPMQTGWIRRGRVFSSCGPGGCG